MIKINWLKWSIILLITISVVACEKNDPVPEGNGEEQTVSDEVLMINNWIQANMNDVYLWNNFIPDDLNPKTEEDPRAFFYKMIYESEDKWSWITSDYNSLMNDLQGTPVSFGYYPSFFSNSAEQVFISIQYVYEGSPADDAGLKRGDLIYSINGQTMDIDNYSDVYYNDQSQHTYILAKIEFEQVVPTTDTVEVTARQIDANPVLHHEVMDMNGTKTGYLVYSEFISGVDDKYLDTLDYVFSSFKDSGVTELIVDLRYNPGGDINTAAYLASAIVPKSNMEAKDILVLYQFNDEVQSFYESNSEYQSRLRKKFVQNDFNLNLSEVHFLTTQRTASASELIITGLEPYMNVTVIGEVTVGKYTGAWVIPDLDEPPRHNYAMIPIVLKYANADGVTEFKNGLDPDYPIDYNPVVLYGFGDSQDPMMAKAFELIGGTAATKKTTQPFSDVNILIDKKRLWKENAFDRIFTEKDVKFYNSNKSEIINE